MRYQLSGRSVAGTVTVEAPGGEGAFAQVSLAGARFSAPVVDGRARIPFALDEVTLWYANGEGEPFLYDMRITLEGNGLLDERRHRIGFRTIEVVRDKRRDGRGTRCLHVNGKEIFCRGYN